MLSNPFWIGFPFRPKIRIQIFERNASFFLWVSNIIYQVHWIHFFDLKSKIYCVFPVASQKLHQCIHSLIAVALKSHTQNTELHYRSRFFLVSFSFSENRIEPRRTFTKYFECNQIPLQQSLYKFIGSVELPHNAFIRFVFILLRICICLILRLPRNRIPSAMDVDTFYYITFYFEHVPFACEILSTCNMRRVSPSVLILYICTHPWAMNAQATNG